MAHRKSARFVPPPLLFAATWLMQRRLSRGRPPSPASRSASLLVAAGGGLLGLAAVGALKRHGTLIAPDHPGRSTTLVTDGPFARTRNPMYLSLTILLLAHAVHRRSLRAVLPVVGFVTTLNRTQIPREELALRGRFGRKYRRYARQTPRWLRHRP